jgi:hypothetical protein
VFPHFQFSQNPQRALFTAIPAVLGIFLAPKSWSQSVDANAGTRNFAFIEVMTSAKSMGLAENQVAHAEGTDAIGVNPAGLSRAAAGRSISATMRYFDWGEAGGQIGYVFGASAHRFALGAAYLNAGDIQMRDELGVGGETVKPTAFSPSLSYAWIANEAWRLGATLKGYQEYLGDFEGSQSASGMGVDLGALFSPGAKNIGFGFALTNLGRKLSGQTSDGDESGATLAIFKLGFFYTPTSWKKLRLLAESQWDDAENPKFGVGAEWNAHSALTFRTGIRASMQELRYAYRNYAEGIEKPLYGGEARRLGAGCSVDLGHIVVDYGLQWWTDLGFVHGLTLKHSWGG